MKKEDFEIVQGHIHFAERGSYYDSTTEVVVENILVNKEVADILNKLICVMCSKNITGWNSLISILTSGIILDDSDEFYVSSIRLTFKNCEFADIEDYPNIVIPNGVNLYNLSFYDCTIHKLQIGYKKPELVNMSSMHFHNTEGCVNLKNILSNHGDNITMYNSDVSIVLDNTLIISDVLKWASTQVKCGIMPTRGINSFTYSKAVKDNAKNVRKVISKSKSITHKMYTDYAYKESSCHDTDLKELNKEIVKAGTYTAFNPPTAIALLGESNEIVAEAKKLEGTMFDGKVVTGVYKINKFKSNFTFVDKSYNYMKILRSRVELISSSGLFVLTRRGTDKEVQTYFKQLDSMTENKRTRFGTQEADRIYTNTNNAKILSGSDTLRFLSSLKNTNSDFIVPIGGTLDSNNEDALSELQGCIRFIENIDTLLYSADEYSLKTFQLMQLD